MTATARPDPLDENQRARLAAVYEALRLVIGEDRMASEVIDLAAYILTGERPPDPCSCLRGNVAYAPVPVTEPEPMPNV